MGEGGRHGVSMEKIFSWLVYTTSRAPEEIFGSYSFPCRNIPCTSLDFYIKLQL